MPVYSRKYLRQTLGKSYIRDTLATITDTDALPNTPFNQRFSADVSLSGQGLYANSTIYVTGPDDEYRCSSFNAGSGNWLTRQVLATVVASGSEFEIHSRLPATEKNLMLDETIKRLRVHQEVGFSTGTGGADFFNIEGAASPNYIVDVLDAYWFANPAGSLDRDMQRFDDIRLVLTGSGRELRVAPAPGGSAQVILDAILQMTLGQLSTATVNLPDDRWVLAGAAAGCYNLLIQNAPGQNVGNIEKQAQSWAREFIRLSGHFAPLYTRKIRLEEPEDLTALGYPGRLVW
jgi:hypothetical protein